ncbi:MAG: hypothetical protein M1832_002005 [Thelocarpon impressellum]|nr:MAG: hypothetical protein M1832_002005 [Thelocarpon impressellum]
MSEHSRARASAADSSAGSRLNIQLPPVAGVKRPAPSPSLLPAFEPLSSSPSFPRPLKRLARVSPAEHEAEIQKYPTPLPTSSTGIVSSSPPQLARARPAPLSRPSLQRTLSTVSERSPLSAVPSVNLPEDGEPVLMGRSSNSSHYQLSANRLISRVHVRAAYVPASSPLAPDKVEVLCMGWNGVKVHCQGRAWDLGKGDSFTSETEHDIMLDAQDSRVLIAWPCRRKGSASSQSDSNSVWDDENSPRRGQPPSAVNRTFGSSPLRRARSLQSPVSPTPVGHAHLHSSSTLIPSEAVVPVADPVVVYEDRSSDEASDELADATQISTQLASQPIGASQSSGLSDAEDFSDQDEENDPIIQAFGPQGDNILPRMASCTTSEPSEAVRLQPLKESASPKQQRSSSESTNAADPTALANHVINQLAYSRLSSTPLSTILNHLPAELRREVASHAENEGLSREELKAVLDMTICIGEVSREGKDAAGKVLESEYYYIPDMDTDEKRRDAVVDGLRKPGLRNCRKSHKQYYWRKPKKP